ncbi:hypothetical protein GTA08_BOTSDO06387 [Botryosphaeria dothidea]|uniref:G-protein coupled receptors family 2 profile 2 domain-containing protein n=1 Tax=Botryosphaeria dothidea TaxID=55169 RepID=A0A8H4N1J9_9PEZI|nr:hypothetical protein GTA08_BOTSDO06387 [Botryosphaeria dothidea]
MAEPGTKLSSIMRGMESKKHEYLIVARTSASISLLTTSSIILTYLISPRFRKPMNRLLFYASLGNIFQAIALFICTSGLPFPGKTMSLCRFQGFCIQMFTTSAVLWTLSMALNVYLIYFRKFDTAQLRRLEPWYIAINYGWPFGHTFILLMLDISPKQSGIFGPAVVRSSAISSGNSSNWAIVFIVTVIFAITGITMIQQNYAMRKIHRGPDGRVTLLESQEDHDRPYIPRNQIVRVTDIHLSSVVPDTNYSSSAATRNTFNTISSRGLPQDEHYELQSPQPGNQEGTAATTTDARQSGEKGSQKSRLKLPPKVRLPPGVHVRLEDYAARGRSPLQSFSSMLAQPRQSQTQTQTQSLGSINTAHGSAPATSSLRSAAWPCEESGKVDFVVHTGSAQQTTTTTTCTAGTTEKRGRHKWLRNLSRWRRRRAARRALRDPRASQAASAYAKVAFLMFLGLIIIWVPASANRIYSLVHGVPSPLFTVIHAAVGPLQGFLHWIIYVATSWPQVRSMSREARQSFRERLRRRQGTQT